MQNSTVTSLPHGLPPKAQRFLVHKSCVRRTATKILQPPKPRHRLLYVQITHAKAQTLRGDQFFHIYKTPLILLTKPFQVQYQRFPWESPRALWVALGSPWHSQPCSTNSGTALQVPVPLPAPLPAATPIAKGMGQRCQADSQHQALTFYPSSASPPLGDAGLASVSLDAIWALPIKTTGHLGTSKRRQLLPLSLRWCWTIRSSHLPKSI